MASGSGGLAPSTLLSHLVIDADVNWNGRNITNIGSLLAASIPVAAGVIPAIAVSIATHTALVSGIHGLQPETSFYAMMQGPGDQSIPSGVTTQIDFVVSATWCTPVGWFSSPNHRFTAAYAGIYVMACGIGATGFAAGDNWRLDYQTEVGGLLRRVWDMDVQNAGEIHGAVWVDHLHVGDQRQMALYHNHGANIDISHLTETWWSVFMIPQTIYH